MAELTAIATFLIGIAVGIFYMRGRNQQLQAFWQEQVTQAQQATTREIAQRETLMGTMSDRFKALADEIIDLKGRRIAEQSERHLGQIMQPVQERLREFRDSLEQTRASEGAERAALRTEVNRLFDLNKVLGEETHRLTNALQTSSKVRGDWGELVLERILEAAGLSEGQEYALQNHGVHEDGSRVRPDAVIFLPGQRRLVVDAKVSLTAYIELANAQNDAERKAANKRLAASLRAHMRGLAEKRYHALPNTITPDFTIMFVPLEAAFVSAVGEDPSLLTDAWALNVLPAGPSTLMFSVRTVAHLWRQDARLKNVDKIAERGAQLYDRLADFLVDLQKVGDRLDQARDAYASAKDRLTTRKGNVLRQAQMLKEYGVQPTKTIGDAWQVGDVAEVLM